VAPAWAGRRLSELDIDGLARVTALSRLGVGQIPVPDLVTQEGDVVYVAVSADRLEDFDEHLGNGSRGHGTGGHP
jgi:trk system potassium uptake protein TrkA